MPAHVTELPGLPGDPPYPLQFALPGISTFREGYVLQFALEGQDAWVANFQPGLSHYCAFLELHTSRIAVVAGGQGYVIDARRRVCQYVFGGDIMWLLKIEGTAEFLTVSNVDIERHSSSHRVWRSERIAWDGIGRVEVSGSTMRGHARHFDDTWHTFELELATGKHTGGAYSEA